MKYLSITDTILRNRENFFQEIKQSSNLPKKMRDLLASSFVFFAFYGIVMGIGHGWEQARSSLLKLPILFLLTLAICGPSLHYFNILYGSKQSAQQTLTLILTAIATTSVLAASLAPISLFFIVTGSSYSFLKLMHVVFLGVAGYQGTVFLRQGVAAVHADASEESQGMRKSVFMIWLLLYALVGTQMAWLLSPYIGNPEMPFLLFRHAEGNFYLDVLQTLAELLGF